MHHLPPHFDCFGYFQTRPAVIDCCRCRGWDWKLPWFNVAFYDLQWVLIHQIAYLKCYEQDYGFICITSDMTNKTISAPPELGMILHHSKCFECARIFLSALANTYTWQRAHVVWLHPVASQYFHLVKLFLYLLIHTKCAKKRFRDRRLSTAPAIAGRIAKLNTRWLISTIPIAQDHKTPGQRRKCARSAPKDLWIDSTTGGRMVWTEPVEHCPLVR